MATIQKTRQFLEESELHQHYASIVEYTLTYFIAKAESEGNTNFARELKRAKDDYQQEFAKGIEMTEEVYSELFTDDELDNLIILNLNPAMKKARAMTSEIMKKISEHRLAARK